MKSTLLLLLIAPTLLCAQPPKKNVATKLADRAQSITIHRDKYGVPHIFAKTDADAVFGLLYTQCEDDFERVEMNYITALGRTAEVGGEDLIYNDLRSKLYADTNRAILNYGKSKPEMKALMNAFADGVNYYLSTHPDVKPKLLTVFKPWYPLLFSEGSIGGDLSNVSVNDLKAFYGEAKVPATVIDESAEPKGSNGFAIAPSKSATGNALLLINPHTSFYFRSEVHVISQEGLNAYGAVTWGQFFIYQGFNANCGWMHTTTFADAVDEYLETVSRNGNNFFYKHDGKWKPLIKKSVTVAYKTSTGVSKKDFTVYETHHGPIIADVEGKWKSIHMMDDPVNALQQSFMRTKATGYESYKQVMKLNANSSNNTVFADNQGNIAYWHGNFVPKRDPKLNWNQPQDGSLTTTDWKGYHAIDEIINIHNPANGWIQNCNATPFTAAAENSPKKADYPAYMAPDGQNYRGVNADRVLRRQEKFTLESLIAAAYDPALTAFEKLIPALSAAYIATSDLELKKKLEEPMKVLEAWDKSYGVSSVGASLAILWGRNLQGVAMSRLSAVEQRNHPGDQAFLIDYMIANTSGKEKVDALASVVDGMNAAYGSWQTGWGEINRFQRLTGRVEETFDDSRQSLPVASTSSFWGSLAAYGSRPYPGTKKFYGNVGNSFIAVVEFGKRIRAKTIVTGGSSSNPSSQHFADQALMYTKGEFKDVFFYQEDIEKNTERKYRPGE